MAILSFPFVISISLKWRSTLGSAQTGLYVNNTFRHVFACTLCGINHGPDILFRSQQGFYLRSYRTSMARPAIGKNHNSPKPGQTQQVGGQKKYFRGNQHVIPDPCLSKEGPASLPRSNYRVHQGLGAQRARLAYQYPSSQIPWVVKWLYK